MSKSFDDYKKVSLATDTALFTLGSIKNSNIRQNDLVALQVLLVKRNIEPYKGMWALPGGFVDAEKSITESAKSTLLNKTSIKKVYTEQIYTYGDNTERDPRGRVITVAYLALAEQSNIHIDETEIESEAKLFWVGITREKGKVLKIKLVPTNGEDIGHIELAFDHKEIIIDALNRLSGKVMYSDIAFNLMPEKFTIKELQLAYQAITGRLISNFKVFIGDKIIETDEIKGDLAHRPARLYKFNNNV